MTDILVIESVCVFEGCILHTELCGTLVHTRDKRALRAAYMLSKCDCSVIRRGDNDAFEKIIDRHFFPCLQIDL